MGYHARYIFYSGVCDVSISEFLLYRAIFQVDVRNKGQVQLYGYNNVLFFGLIFKYAVAIAKPAVLFAKRFELAGSYFKSLATFEYILQFHPVSANVLNRRRPD